MLTYGSAWFSMVNVAKLVGGVLSFSLACFLDNFYIIRMVLALQIKDSMVWIKHFNMLYQCILMRTTHCVGISYHYAYFLQTFPYFLHTCVSLFLFIPFLGDKKKQLYVEKDFFIHIPNHSHDQTNNVFFFFKMPFFSYAW